MKKNKYSLSLSLKFLCRVVLLTIFGTSFLFFSVKGDPVEPQRVTVGAERCFSLRVVSGDKETDFFQVLL